MMRVTAAFYQIATLYSQSQTHVPATFSTFLLLFLLKTQGIHGVNLTFYRRVLEVLRAPRDCLTIPLLVCVSHSFAHKSGVLGDLSDDGMAGVLLCDGGGGHTYHKLSRGSWVGNLGLEWMGFWEFIMGSSEERGKASYPESKRAFIHGKFKIWNSVIF